MTKAPLALTMGEPAGIGGELAIAAWQVLRRHDQPFFLIDDPDRIAALCDMIGEPVPIARVASAARAARDFKSALPVLPLAQKVPLSPGSPTPDTAHAVLESIETAVRLTLSGDAGAVVTNPIQKAVLQAAGFTHPGHTEFLGALAGVSRTVMMLAGAGLRVVPATVHVPLSEVPQRLSVDGLVETGRILHHALERDFTITRPRIAVSGLNPHAGEDGRMGHEEMDIVTPAIDRLRAEGVCVSGPHPADTMFHERARANYDAALCMYHDQALIPLKTLAFDEGVNVTLGLPFVRTSPDHGTATDIAGQGTARAESLICAMRLAADLAARRNVEVAA